MDVSILCLLPILILLLSILFILQTKKMVIVERNVNVPPGPSRLPIIGNLHQIGKLPHRSLWQLAKQHGPLMHLQLGHVSTVVISSAKMAEEVLRTHDLQFCSRPPLVGPRKLSYQFKDIAFSPFGEYWRDLKKICFVQLFNTKKVQSFQFIRENEVDLMTDLIARSSCSSPGTPINISEIMLSLVNNIICRIALGKRFQDEVCTRSRFQDMLQEAQALLGGFYVEDYFPSIGWIIDVLIGQTSRLEKNFREMDDFYQSVIDEHLNSETQEVLGHEDIIHVLLQIRKDAIGGIDLTIDHIKAALMDIFVAGTDTSTAALVWGMTELMKNPRVMRKAQDEIRNAIRKKRMVEESDLEQLQYLRAVVKEILRMHPPGPLLAPRETMEECKISGYNIFPKTRVIVSPWAIGRDPKCWENPEEFYPERFMDGSIDFKGLHFELVPFGAGRRHCPGINLGAAIVTLALSNILYSFDWKLPCGMNKEDIDMEETPGLTTHKKLALHLVPISYNQHL